MKIPPYNPDNGVMRNFMPNPWIFLLQSITTPQHQVLLIDGNARAMTEQELARALLIGQGEICRPTKTFIR